MATPSSANRLHLTFLFLGIGAIVTGIVLVITAPDPSDFGWFSYAPLGDSLLVPANPASPQEVVGAIVALAGLVLTAFCAGWLIASRRAGRATSSGRPTD